VIARWQAAPRLSENRLPHNLQHKALLSEIVATRVASRTIPVTRARIMSATAAASRHYSQRRRRRRRTGGLFGHMMGGMFGRR